MNEQGHVILYDALMALILIFIILICTIYVLNQDSDVIMDNNVNDKLDLLASTHIHGEKLLVLFSYDDSTAKQIVSEIFSNECYSLKDLTTNMSISSNSSKNYKSAVSSRKIVGGHEYELILFI